jgi:hypothetical protein
MKMHQNGLVVFIHFTQRLQSREKDVISAEIMVLQTVACPRLSAATH